MKRSGKNIHRCIVCLIVSLLLSCQVCNEGAWAFPLSIEEEQELGKKFLINVSKNYVLADDDFANQYINALGHYLMRPIETKPFPFRFHIIMQNELNAFAGPGGHIFVLSGLIETAEIDELSAVICHEMGHVTARHLAQRIEQSKKIGIGTVLGILLGILVGGPAGGAIMTGSTAAGMQAQLAYSRDDERQADQLGCKYMEQSGFDPSGMITMLEKMEEGQFWGASKVPAYLLTHPGGPERISDIEIMLTNYHRKPASKEVVQFRTLFPYFKDVLRAKSLEPYEAEKLFNKELEKDPNSAPAHFGLGLVCKERLDYSKAIEHFQKALERQPDLPPILRNLGETYQLNGQNAKAVAVLDKALEIDDQDKSTLFLLAVGYQNLEEYTKAIQLYEKLTSMEPVKNQVYYNLGVSFGRQGRLALAHYNFGIYFKRLGRPEKARFHLQKAEELSQGDPALRTRIQKAMKEFR